jgi:hypothetical protein
MSDDSLRIAFPARPQLIAAEIRKGEVRFELEIADAKAEPVATNNWAQGLKFELREALRVTDAGGPTVDVIADERDPARIVILFRTDGTQSARERHAFIGVLVEAGVQMDNAVARGITNAFTTLRMLGPAGQAQRRRRREKQSA